MSINPFRAVTIAVDGTAEAVQWDATRGSLTHLQQAVDGLVALVALHEHVTMSPGPLSPSLVHPMPAVTAGPGVSGRWRGAAGLVGARGCGPS